jgi:hypothetical protein
MMGLPEQYEVTEAEMWGHYVSDNLKDVVTMDHVVLAKRVDTGEPVWVRVSN